MLAVIIFLSGYFVNVIASQEDYLTAREDACFEWVHSLKDQCAIAFNELDPQAQRALNSNIDSLAMDLAIHQYATKILKAVTEANLSIPDQRYTTVFLASVMRKVKKAMVRSDAQDPIGPTTARLYVFKVILTPEEHLLLQKNNYIANSDAGDAVLKKYAYHVVCCIQKYDKKDKYAHYYKDVQKSIHRIAEEKRESILKLYNLK